jgi:23S rRNA (adenine2503-C2)-methyltransferase
VLVRGLNSDLQNAALLCKIIKELGLAKVNLIPANSVKELGITAPEKKEVLLFRNFLMRNGAHATLRKPRGQDIEAACGQLRLRHERENRLQTKD